MEENKIYEIQLKVTDQENCFLSVHFPIQIIVSFYIFP